MRREGEVGRKRWRRAAASAVAGTVLLALLCPAAAAPRQIVIPPGKLRPEKSSQHDTRQPFAVGNRDGQVVRFWAPVHLPVGAVVKRIVHQHASDGVAGSTTVVLWRVGSEGDEFRQLPVAQSSGWEDTGAPYNFITATGVPNPGGRARIRAGRRYGIEATVDGTGASIGWIKIVYE